MEATKVSVVSSGCWLLFSRGKEVEKRTISFSESGSSDAVYYVQRARWAPTIAEMEEKDFGQFPCAAHLVCLLPLLYPKLALTVEMRAL